MRGCEIDELVTSEAEVLVMAEHRAPVSLTCARDSNGCR